MKPIATILVLLTTLLAGACSGGGSGSGSVGGGGILDGINSAPPDTGPGCYDHKNRKERTILTEAECKTQGWVWRTS